MKSWLNRERGDDKFRTFPREESWLPVPVPRTKILPVKVIINCPSVGEREESDLILDGEVVSTRHWSDVKLVKARGRFCLRAINTVKL